MKGLNLGPFHTLTSVVQGHQARHLRMAKDADGGLGRLGPWHPGSESSDMLGLTWINLILIDMVNPFNRFYEGLIWITVMVQVIIVMAILNHFD